jgi:hypothetical protein
MQLQLPPMPPVVVRWITTELTFYQHWDFWLSLFTLLLVVATFLLVLETRSMRTSSDKSMRDMLKHAEVSADAANRSADSTQALVHLGQRAWVTVVRCEPGRSEIDRMLQSVTTPITNTGETPAIDVEIWQDYRIETGLLNNFPDINDAKHVRAGVVGPGATFLVETEVLRSRPGERPQEQPRYDIPPDVQEALHNGAMHVYIYGKVVYKDIFGQEHMTVWCLVDHHHTLVYASRFNCAY